ncbi:hypothetical protein ACIPYS_06710 [Kitasatospora sp. NPDC089913]|uniref:hypothetical protein n=1 Tax=Kitasatospora sp. NPDC089913 TaxID=3364080 RepID=UPI0038264F30
MSIHKRALVALVVAVGTITLSSPAHGNGSVGVAVDDYQNRYSDYQRTQYTVDIHSTDSH